MIWHYCPNKIDLTLRDVHFNLIRQCTCSICFLMCRTCCKDRSGCSVSRSLMLVSLNFNIAVEAIFIVSNEIVMWAKKVILKM